MRIANPIYDIVFKYLMEDERIARTILSALLKQDVVKVVVRPHEYTNVNREPLSVFRIDFAATVREADGTERLILIKLQKTWLPTETLRFRQYLGVHYSNPANIAPDGNSLPMVAIYLLGHKVGDIEEPVLYMKNHAFDYDGRQVTQGLPDPFVESLTHDSIIVQIPRLHGHINNRLDEVLSVFDQSRQSAQSQHMLDIDETLYDEGDDDMQRILRRLLMAGTSAEMRHDMNVEDEYFSIIEKQDTEILMKTRELAEKTVELEEKNAQLDEKNAQLDEKSAQLDEKSAQLAKSIKLLLSAGMPPEEIAANLGVSLDTVMQLR
ncbi:MAG: hypothetical protein IJT46_04935 [Bacteroidaceae bacterium]|nr:hypothetical protein [Bacteroidaceae bacterium]